MMKGAGKQKNMGFTKVEDISIIYVHGTHKYTMICV